jgi:hypothetical protein
VNVEIIIFFFRRHGLWSFSLVLRFLCILFLNFHHSLMKVGNWKLGQWTLVGIFKFLFHDSKGHI